MSDLTPSGSDLPLPDPRPRDAWRGGPLRHGLLLGLFALVAALVLSGMDTATKDPIAARKSEDLLRSLAQVVPGDLHTNDLSKSTHLLDDAVEGEVRVYLARDGEGAVSAVAFELTGFGYSGAIRVLTGFAPDGTILGVRVLAHTETPGLGDLIEARKGDWIHGFAGLSLGAPAEPGWAVKKDGGTFDQFSGATITPRAVVATVLRALQLHARHAETLNALGGKAGS